MTVLLEFCLNVSCIMNYILYTLCYLQVFFIVFSPHQSLFFFFFFVANLVIEIPLEVKYKGQHPRNTELLMKIYYVFF